MEYNIGRLADIFGIASQTIHYYEKIGILKPRRDEKNGYRIYSDYDFQQLASIKKLRNAEFSLKGSSFLYDNENEIDVCNRYKKRRKELQSEIKEKEFIIDKLEEYIDKIEALWMGNDFIVEDHTEYYRYNFKKFDINDRNVIPWFRNLFFTTSSLKFIVENDKFISYEFGLLASRETFFKCNLKKTKNVDLIHEGKFATRIFKYYNNVNLTMIGSEVETYLDNNGFKLRSYPFSELMVSYNDENKNKVNIVRIVLPIN